MRSRLRRTRAPPRRASRSEIYVAAGQRHSAERVEPSISDLGEARAGSRPSRERFYRRNRRDGRRTRPSRRRAGVPLTAVGSFGPVGETCAGARTSNSTSTTRPCQSSTRRSHLSCVGAPVVPSWRDCNFRRSRRRGVDDLLSATNRDRCDNYRSFALGADAKPGSAPTGWIDPLRPALSGHPLSDSERTSANESYRGSPSRSSWPTPNLTISWLREVMPSLA